MRRRGILLRNFQAGHAVIFVYGITHFVGKIFIGTIAYAENVEAVLL